MAKLISEQHNNAVMLFFVLSGFSIRLSLKNDILESRSAFKKYIWRRSVRILPLYWLALLWTAIMGTLWYGLSDPSFSLFTLIGNIVFLQTSASASGAWFSPYGLNGPLWSLSYEVFYYALFPLVIIASRQIFGRRHSSKQLWLLSLMASVAALGVNWLVPTPFSNFLTLWHVWMLGYYIADQWLNRRTPSLAFVSAFVLVTVQVGLILNGLTSDTFSSLRNGSIIALIGAIIVWLALRDLAFTLDPLRKPLDLFFVRIGAGSYTLYLLHYPVLLAVTPYQGDQDLLLFVDSGLGMSILMLFFALIICPFVENQSLRLKNLRPGGALTRKEEK